MNDNAREFDPRINGHGREENVRNDCNGMVVAPMVSLLSKHNSDTSISGGNRVGKGSCSRSEENMTNGTSNLGINRNGTPYPATFGQMEKVHLVNIHPNILLRSFRRDTFVGREPPEKEPQQNDVIPFF
jgi:hypothetical protein